MYWLVSLPLVEEQARIWSRLQSKTVYEADLSKSFRFELPELRVGTLDSLMVLSDDLVKVNSVVEAVVNKLRRQLYDMTTSGNYSSEREDISVEGLAPAEYLERFAWNEAKYPPRRSLKETVDNIMETIQKLEDDLKVRGSEYNQQKSQLSQISRKQTGSLAVRDLGSIVSPKDVVNTENLVTLFVVVPRHTKKEWLATYESITEYIVPRSSKVIEEDSDYSLFSVTLFRRVEDNFKSAARPKGFQVREYEYDAEKQGQQEQSTQRLKREVEGKRTQLEQWSSTAYGEAFSAWIHICAIRLFTESILRYGLPPKFLGCLLKPNPKQTTKLRKLLGSMFGSNGTKQFYDNEASGNAGAGVGDTEMFPYVSFTISIDG